MRKRRQERELMGVSEVAREAGHAEHERQNPEQSLAHASPLLQLVETPEKLRLLLGCESAAKQQLLHHLGQELGIPAVSPVPSRQRLVGAVGIELDPFLVLVHGVSGVHNAEALVNQSPPCPIQAWVTPARSREGTHAVPLRLIYR